MKSETPPLPDPRFPFLLRRAAPPKIAGGALLALAVGAAVSLRFGPVTGVVTALLQGALLFWADRSPTSLLSFLLFSFALPRMDWLAGPGFHLKVEDLAISALCLQALYSGKRFQPTPLETPIAFFLASLGLAALAGYLAGTIASPLTSALTILKQISWICGFYAGAWMIRTRANRERLAGSLLAGIVLLALAAILFLVLHPHERPFNRLPYLGESNHVGGLAVIALLFFLSRTEVRWKMGALLSLLLLAASGSRTAMMGAAAGLLVLFLRTRSRSVGALLAGGILLVLLAPASRQRLDRLTLEWDTWQRTESRVQEGFSPCWSRNRNRLEVWSLLIEETSRAPFFGTGPGSRHRILYESQYMMTLAETGLAGLAAFFFLLWTVARHGRNVPWILPALAAMALMGLTCNAFFISRLAGPWWILAGAFLQRGEESPPDPFPAPREGE